MVATHQPTVVELLYFDGCPNYQAYLPRLRRLLPISVRLVLRNVATAEAAQEARFLGSPTVRVNGQDLEPGADERPDYGLQCRLYRTSSGWQRFPPDDWVLSALNETMRQVA